MYCTILKFYNISLSICVSIFLFSTVTKVDNKVLWLNMLTLFWLSLIPFATASMGENSFASVPVTVYAIILILVPISNILLINGLCQPHGTNSELSKRCKGHGKSYITLSLNVFSAIIAFVGFPKVAFILFALTALMWFLPDYQHEHTTKKSINQN